MSRRSFVTFLLACELVLAIAIARCVADLRPAVLHAYHATIAIALHRRHRPFVHALDASFGGNSRVFRESAPAPNL